VAAGAIVPNESGGLFGNATDGVLNRVTPGHNPLGADSERAASGSFSFCANFCLSHRCTRGLFCMCIDVFLVGPNGGNSFL
jgi:hypothetical protein